MPASGFIAGFRTLFRSFELLKQPGVRLYVVIPLLINVVLFAVTLIYAFHQVAELREFIAAQFSQQWAWLEWFLWILWPLFILISLLLIYFTFVIVANLIAAPFNGFLSAAIERHLTGQLPEDGNNWKTIPRELGRAFKAELIKLGYFAVRGIPLLLLFLIPVVNAVAPVIWFFFAAWMLALEYMDFPMGNRGYTFPEERRLLAGQRATVMGFGSATLLLTMMPIVNFIAMPVAVAGATRLWVEQQHRIETGQPPDVAA